VTDSFHLVVPAFISIMKPQKEPTIYPSRRLLALARAPFLVTRRARFVYAPPVSGWCIYGISALTRSTWVARLWLTWSFASDNITARRFASRRRSLVAATVGGTRANARTERKEREREREEGGGGEKKEEDERSVHVLVQSWLSNSSSRALLLVSLPLRPRHTATKILPVLIGMR